MSSVFQTKKRKILEQLATPDDDYTDLSPKGSVDAGIRQLVDELNAQEEYVTTSSCAGRVAVFLEGCAKGARGGKDTDEPGIAASAGGKGGGGKWLYISHDPVTVHDSASDGEIMQSFGLQTAASVSFQAPDEQSRFVHFKFEPMILHILTSSLPAAQTILSAAMSAGFRESGISNVVTSASSTGVDLTPMVAVRSSGLALDSIVGYLDPSSNTVRAMVSDLHLRTLVSIANRRFCTNEDRKQRFRDALLGSGDCAPSQGREWEPADMRRERKRAEGLLRREGLARERTAQKAQNSRDSDGEEQDAVAS